jgi:hypothetical protein
VQLSLQHNWPAMFFRASYDDDDTFGDKIRRR